ncbi:MAG: FecR domain-containing protein [Deferribacterales bacterium]
MKKLIISLIIICFASFAYAAETTGTVVEVQGAVDIVQGSAVMGKLAKPGTVLSLKDILRTKRKGYAVVKLNDGTDIKIFEKSRLVFTGNGRTKDGFNTELKNGKVLFRVEKMRDVAGDFRIKTPNAVIGVKGTLVGLNQNPGGLALELYKGSLHVSPLGQPGQDEPGVLAPEGSGSPAGEGGGAGAGEGSGSEGDAPQGSGAPGQDGGAGGVMIGSGTGMTVGQGGGFDTYPIGGNPRLFPGVGGGDEQSEFNGVGADSGRGGDFGGSGEGGFAPPQAEGGIEGSLAGTGGTIDGLTGDISGSAGDQESTGNHSVDINIIIR